MSQGRTVKEVSRDLGVTRDLLPMEKGIWGSEGRQRKASEGAGVERENSRLKKAVAELILDKVTLKEPWKEISCFS